MENLQTDFRAASKFEEASKEYRGNLGGKLNLWGQTDKHESCFYKSKMNTPLIFHYRFQVTKEYDTEKHKECVSLTLFWARGESWEC